MSERVAPALDPVTVFGTGVIGRSWIVVFVRAGCRVRAWDADAGQRERAAAWFRGELTRLMDAGDLTPEAATEWRSRVFWAGSAAEALEGTAWVQESGPERLDVKQQLYAELDRLAPAGAILGSSTSAIDMTAITQALSPESAARCIVAHPVNPPHVIPAVEVLGGARTSPNTVDRTCGFLTSVGQTPVLLKRFAAGFILNRMQAALVREAVNLVRDGVADVDAVDAVIRDGLGLRWALMGPFATASANADGGAREYFTRYGPAYTALWQDLRTDTVLTPELVDRIGAGAEQMLDGVTVAELMQWRDQLAMGIRRLKAEQPLRRKA
jgi:3-hydroxyacyl-CoA dehydrogenase